MTTTTKSLRTWSVYLCGSKFRPNDAFDPRNVVRHSGVHARRVLAAAVFAERRYPDLRVHTDVVSVLHL